ncbi:EIF4E1 [Scenedesmus sp. PABB004]|nr:EIF4E1 [Scenedesmus sp. PABB004]
MRSSGVGSGAAGARRRGGVAAAAAAAAAARQHQVGCRPPARRGVAAAAAAPAAAAAFGELAAWLASRGGEVGPVSIGDCRMGDAVVRGLVATADVAAGDTLLRVPLGAALRDDAPPDPFPGAPWNARLAAHLLEQRAAGAAAPAAAYLATLPAPGADGPLLLRPGELAEVQYPPAVAAITSYQDAAGAAFDAWRAAGGAAAARATWEEWAWALHMVQSRSIRLAIAGAKVMIPGVDMLNHGGAAANGQLVLGKATWQLEGEPAICFVATAAIAAGEQVLWSYGTRGNDDFFAYHGFALPDNPDDDAALFDSPAAAAAWAVSALPALRGAAGLGAGALAALADAAAGRAAAEAGAHCSAAAIQGTSSSLLLPPDALTAQLQRGASAVSSARGGRRDAGGGGPAEAAVLSALKGLPLARRLASFRLHRPEWGTPACAPTVPELVLRRDGALDVRLPAVLAALLDAAGGGEAPERAVPALVAAATAARGAELLAALGTSAAADEACLRAGGGGEGVAPAVLAYRLSKKQLPARPSTHRARSAPAPVFCSARRPPAPDRPARRTRRVAPAVSRIGNPPARSSRASTAAPASGSPAIRMAEDAPVQGGAADDTPDFSKRHPLEHKWTLWFDNPSTKQSLTRYGQGLRPVYSFDSVEDFWCLYNNIKAPSQLQPSATYYLFKDGIEPKWEDPMNAHGGSWVANAPRTPNGRATLDAWWLHAVLACIGEQFDEGDEVCGVTVNIRAGKDRIELWTKTAANEALQTSLAKQLKQMLDIPDSNKIGFVVFSEKLTSGKSKDKYSV